MKHTWHMNDSLSESSHTRCFGLWAIAIVIGASVGLDMRCEGERSEFDNNISGIVEAFEELRGGKKPQIGRLGAGQCASHGVRHGGNFRPAT